MKPVRTAVLAAVVLAAFGLPATAYALAAADDDTATTPASTPHPKAPAGTEAAEPDDDAGEDASEDAGEDKADDASAAGRAHAEAMKAWAHCVAEAASGPKTGARTGPPKLACGDKPMAPGLAKHLAAGTGPFAPGKHHAQKQKAHGKAHGRTSR
jgi:hypothetical protein